VSLAVGTKPNEYPQEHKLIFSQVLSSHTANPRWPDLRQTSLLDVAAHTLDLVVFQTVV
jgi:hypothetical protein